MVTISVTVNRSSIRRTKEMNQSEAEKLVLLERLDRAVESGRRMKEKAKAEADLYIQGGETAATAGIIGYFEGRTGRENLVDGIPLDFAVAAAAYGIGFFGVGRDLSKHLYAIGNGGLAVYGYKWGKTVGSRMAQPAAAARGFAGALPAGGLGDAEINRLVAAARGY